MLEFGKHVVLLLPRQKGAFRDRSITVDRELFRKKLVASEPAALFAGAVRIVEREKARLDIRHCDSAIGAGEIGRRRFFGTVLRKDHHDAVTEGKRVLDSFRNPSAPFPNGKHPVDNDLDRMPSVLFKRNLFLQPENLPVDTDAEKPLFSRLYQEIPELSLFPPHKGRKDFDLLSFEILEYALHDLVKRVPYDGFPAIGTIRDSYPAEDKPKVVVCLRYRSDRRTRVVRRSFLLDRYRRREAGNIIDIGFPLNAEKLPGVYGERFHITALSFRIEGIERQ